MYYTRVLVNSVAGLLTFAMLVTLSGCASHTKRIGFLSLNSTSIQQNLSNPPLSANDARLLRDPDSNNLNLFVRPSELMYTRSSVSTASFTLFLWLNTTATLPEETPQVYLPFSTNHLYVTEAIADHDNRRILIKIDCDKIGMDLIASALVSPEGCCGVVVFSDSKFFLPIYAKADDRRFTWGSVWISENKIPERAIIRNDLEFPVRIYSIKIGEEIHVINRTLSRGATLSVKAPDWWCGQNFSSFHVIAGRNPTIPNKFILPSYTNPNRCTEFTNVTPPRLK